MGQTRKAVQRSVGSSFFSAQLRGEEPLSRQTAAFLCESAERFGSLKLWERMSDSQLAFVRDPVTGEMHSCSVIGAMREVMGLVVFLGDEGYRFFEKVQEFGPLTLEEHLNHSSVSVNYVLAKELTPPDRAMLDALGHPPVPRRRSPIFRASRPGYFPWYVTESEGGTLAAALEAMAALGEYLSLEGAIELWGHGVYPLIELTPEKTYTLKPIAPLPVDVEPASPPPRDLDRIRRVQSRTTARGGIWEVGQVCSNSVVGEKNERKFPARLTLALDSKTAMILAPPQIERPEVPAADLLVNAVLAAVEGAHKMPEQVRVANAAHKAFLDPLAHELGFEVKVYESLPAFEFARSELLKVF